MALGINSDEHLDKLRQAAELSPDNPLYLHQLAVTYYKRTQFIDCIQACERALKLEPLDSMMWTIKGSALIETDAYEKSLEANRAAIAADPGNHYARYNIAIAYTRQGSKEALGAWRAYLDYAKSDPTQAGLCAKAQEQIDRLESEGN